MFRFIQQVSFHGIILRNAPLNGHLHRAAAGVVGSRRGRHRPAGHHLFGGAVGVHRHHKVGGLSGNVLHRRGAAVHLDADDTVVVRELRAVFLLIAIHAVQQQFAKAVGGRHGNVRAVYRGRLFLLRSRRLHRLHKRVCRNGLHQFRVRLCGLFHRDPFCQRVVRRRQRTEWRTGQRHGQGQQYRK